MDAIEFGTPEGKCFVQPHHIIGVFSQTDGTAMIYVTGGQTFSFKEPAEKVWAELVHQSMLMVEEKNSKIAQSVAGMVKSLKTPRGELN